MYAYQIPDQLEMDLPGLSLAPSGNPNVFEFCSQERETLHLQMCEQAVRIINIQAAHPGNGAGRRIISSLYHLCRESDLILLAIDVAPDAEGFWEALGFLPLDDGSHDWVHQHWHRRYCSLF